MTAEVIIHFIDQSKPMKFSFALVGLSTLVFQILSIGVVSAQTTSPRNPNNPLKDLTSPKEAAFWKTIEDWDATGVPFASLCKNKDKPGILEINVERQHTVEVLLEVAGTQDCEKAESKLKSLTSLSLANKQISNLVPLASLTNLTTLDLNKNQIVDVSPLYSLTNLTYLNLRDNQIEYVKPLAHLTNLNYLNLRNNQIKYMTSLASLNKLNQLNLRNNYIIDVKYLTRLTNLTTLTLSTNRIKDVKPLANLTNLTTLDLNYNQIKDVGSLAGLHKLNQLNLRGNKIAVETCPLNP